MQSFDHHDNSPYRLGTLRHRVLKWLVLNHKANKGQSVNP